MSLFLTIILLILVFGLLVGIHEFGHFIAAKMQGIWVQEFAFGFGPNLFSKKVNGTIYKINLIPLGGYVKLLGESNLQFDPEAQREFEALDDEEEDRLKAKVDEMRLREIEDDEKVLEVISNSTELSEEEKGFIYIIVMNDEKRISNPRRYSNQPIYARLLVVCAGVCMNIVLGIIIYSIYVVAVGYQIIIPNIVDYKFAAANTEKIDALYIDRVYNPELRDLAESVIISIDGQKLTDIAQTASILDSKIDKVSHVEYYKDGIMKSGNFIIDSSNRYDSSVDVDLRNHMVIHNVLSLTPASQSGLKPTDIIISLNGKDISDPEIFANELEANKGKEVDIRILRTKSKEEPFVGEILDYKINLNNPDEESAQSKLGIEYQPNTLYSVGLYHLDYSKSYGNGFSHSLNMVGYQFKVLGDLAKKSFEKKDPKILAETLGGPIAIGAQFKYLIELGNAYDVLNLVGLISLTLAVMNILPLPVVDGGFVFLLLFEKLRGRPLSLRSQQIYNLIGIIFIVTLTIFVTIKDFAQFLL